MRIRVSTRANLYDQRKQEHVERGYRIEDERPIPVNGFCSFVAVREESRSDASGRIGCAGTGRQGAMRPHGKTKLGFFPLPVAEAKRLRNCLVGNLSSLHSIHVWEMEWHLFT